MISVCEVAANLLTYKVSMFVGCAYAGDLVGQSGQTSEEALLLGHTLGIGGRG
jgi:hypothetical protein